MSRDTSHHTSQYIENIEIAKYTNDNLIASGKLSGNAFNLAYRGMREILMVNLDIFLNLILNFFKF